MDKAVSPVLFPQGGLFRILRMRFDFFQVEVTRRCGMNCLMCPSRLWKETNLDVDMDFDTYQLLSMYFPFAGFIHLQGWGEPLQHDRIFEMIEMAKQRSHAGLTTNGMLLNRDANERVVELETDYVAVSVAGATKETHEGIRKGTDFEKIMDNVGGLVEMKRATGSDRPEITLTFLMNKINVDELPAVVDVASYSGVDSVVATNLDYIFDEQTDELRIFSCGNADKRYLDLIREARERALRGNIKLRVPSLQMEEAVMCDANPVKGVVISSEGDLYPCVYLNLPFETIPRIFYNEYTEVERPSFGNVRDFWNAWNSEEYCLFREAYERRMEANKRITEGSRVSPLEVANGLDHLFSQNPLPEVCRSCYKAYGL